MNGTGKTTPSDERLFQLAREHGLELRYTDISGRTHEASPPALRARCDSIERIA